MTEPWDVVVDYDGAAIVSNRPAMTQEQRAELDRKRSALRGLVSAWIDEWREAQRGND